MRKFRRPTHPGFSVGQGESTVHGGRTLRNRPESITKHFGDHRYPFSTRAFISEYAVSMSLLSAAAFVAVPGLSFT